MRAHNRQRSSSDDPRRARDPSTHSGVLPRKLRIHALGFEPALLRRVRSAVASDGRCAAVRELLDLAEARFRLRDAAPDVLLMRVSRREDADDIAELHAAAPACALVLLLDSALSVCAPEMLGAGAQDVVIVDGDLPRLADVSVRAVLRARAHAELWESRQRLRATFDAMSGGVLVTSPSGHVADVNAAALRFLGLSEPGQLVGRKLADVVPSAAPLIVPTDEPRASVGVVGPGGETCTVGYASTQTASGRSLVTVFRDLTRLKASEERRRRAEQLAQVGEITARLGHEIKNPLTSVLVGLQIVESAPELPQPLREILQASLEELQTAARVINELLSTARFSPPSPQLVAVPPTVHEAVEPYLGFAHRKGVAVSIDAPTDPEVWVAADPVWIRRALTNLLVNAVEACARGGKVRISVHVLDRAAVLRRFGHFGGDVVGVCVTDDGRGIAAQELPDIFKPFHTTKRGGTGLGLAVALDALEQHGGTLEVNSAPGKGASFEMVLPAVDPRADDDGPGVQRPCGQRPRGIGHGCWIALGHDEYLRTGRWPAKCRRCSIFQRSNLCCHSADPAPAEPMDE